jgi:hypothetical protein
MLAVTVARGKRVVPALGLILRLQSQAANAFITQGQRMRVLLPSMTA